MLSNAIAEYISPSLPQRVEVELRIGPGAFRVAWSEGRARWSVEPL